MACGFLFLLYLLAASTAVASELASDGEDLQSLSSKPVWRKLLHLPDGKDQVADSTVITPTFFLSKGSAENELRLTVAALRGQHADPQAMVCQFPARFMWLKGQVSLPDTLSIERCENFQRLVPQQLASVSLGYVGSYLGNPASSFGHVLIRLHSRSASSDDRSLLDPAVNFGASVPPEEGSVTYVIKGLLGSYTAAFGSQDYYRHDLVYGHSEQRDIWEYELNLDDQQKLFLVAHLWELQDQQFRYYFLLQNCAYRIAEVLAVLTGETMIPKALLWYAPEKLFHKLKKTNNAQGQSLIKAVRFVPSLQRRLYNDFKQLPESDQHLANQMATALFDDDQIDLSLVQALAVDRQIAVLDFLIDYATYKSPDGPNVAKILAARFGFSKKTIPSELPRVLPPSSETPASMVAVARVWRNGEKPVTRLSGSPFHYDKLGRHEDLGAELVFLNFATDIDADGDIRLADSTFMRVRKSLGDTPDIVNESRLSWVLDTGFRREVRCSNCSGLYARGGAGLAADLLPGFQVSSFIHTDLDLHNFDINISAELGLLATRGKSTLALELEQKLGRESEWHHRYEAQYRYKLKSNIEVRAGFQDRISEKFNASLSYHF